MKDDSFETEWGLPSSTDNDVLYGITEIIYQQKRWSPKTCRSLAQRFAELNPRQLTMSRLSGFIRTEKTSPDYEEPEKPFDDDLQ